MVGFLMRVDKNNIGRLVQKPLFSMKGRVVESLCSDDCRCAPRCSAVRCPRLGGLNLFSEVEAEEVWSLKNRLATLYHRGITGITGVVP